MKAALVVRDILLSIGRESGRIFWRVCQPYFENKFQNRAPEENPEPTYVIVIEL